MFDDIYFSPILVNDLAQVIDLCITQEICGLYHACGTGSVNKYDFGCYMKELFQIKTGQIVRAQSTQHEFLAKRSKNMGMSNQKFCNKLGITLKTPLESIESFYELYQQGYQDKLTKFGKVNV
jgi:dTDP-4-dehydrorhamnose reductase